MLGPFWRTGDRRIGINVRLAEESVQLKNEEFGQKNGLAGFGKSQRAINGSGQSPRDAIIVPHVMKQLSATIAARYHMVDRIGVFEARKSGHESARWRCKIDCTIFARRKPKTKPDPAKLSPLERSHFFYAPTDSVRPAIPIRSPSKTFSRIQSNSATNPSEELKIDTVIVRPEL